MARILLLIVLVWLLYLAFKRIVTGANRAAKASQPKTAEKIVQCVSCGLHVPEAESQMINSLTYCNNPECNPQKQHGD